MRNYAPGETVLYSWNKHMPRWNKSTKRHDLKGSKFEREVTFLRPAGERAVIVCQTPCGPKERMVTWDSLRKISTEVSA